MKLEREVELLKGCQVIAYSFTKYILYEGGHRITHFEGSHDEFMSLRSWHVYLGATTTYQLEARCLWK
jgi:hypothetical protein